MGPLLKDANWVRQAFLVKEEFLDPVDRQNRFHTSASQKFVDTSPGGNLCINPPPQFTRYADLKAPGRFSGNLNGSRGAKGLGRYYSEAFDDNSQLIHMRFGVAQHNSLSTFFTGFYDSGAGQLARTGRARSAFYYLGRAAGFIVSIMSWKLLAVHLLGDGLRFAMNKPSSKFYFLKPTMPLYWNAVTTMVNQIAVNRGIVPRVGDPDVTEKIGDKYQFSKSAMANMHHLLPDVFRENGGIDVYAMANRAQRLARKHHKAMQQALSDNDFVGKDNLATLMHSINTEVLLDKKPSFNEGDDSYISRWFAAASSQPKAKKEDADPTTEEANAAEVADSGVWEFYKAELDDGSAFATFRVNATGQISESFSNSVTESEISSKINGMASQSRSTNFNFGHGNISDGVVGKMIGAVFNSAAAVVSGLADQFEISGLAALGGAAFVDIPKHWQSSSANLPRASYTINLVSPYGNPLSQMINLYVPLCMILAGGLPLSTGKQSYTSPFLVELYDQGRCQTRLGMIDSISVTRGTGNLGFTNDGQPLGIDVSFSVVDMSSVMHMPIAEGFSIGKAVKAAVGTVAAGAAAVGGASLGGPVAGAAAAVAGLGASLGAFDDDTVFTDYMAVLSGMGLADQIYSFRKLKLNLTKTREDWTSWTSASHFASWAGDILPSRMASAIFKGTVR